MKYWAFLSYSHSDKKWGDWLHKALETYRVPRRLIGRESRDGKIPARLFPIFRDREELPALADLGSNINEALNESRYLIVICSPKSAQSRWVGEEIKTFKRLGREDRILALIIDGEPNASDGKPGSKIEDECFHLAMRYRMLDGEASAIRSQPIAADAREDRDGKKNAKLKLLAGLLGLKYDELKRREQERRLRRARAVGVVALILLSLFAFLSIRLFFKEREAVHARDEARFALSRNYFVQGARAKEEGDLGKATAFLARSLRVNPGNDIALVMLVMLLEQNSFSLPTATMRHDDGVTFADWSSDGTRVVTLTERTARVWKASTGEPITGVLKQEDETLGAQFNASGSEVLIACRNTVQVWSCKTGAPRFINPIRQTNLTVVRLSPDGTRIATAAQDGNVRLWDSASGTPLGPPLKHSAPVVAIDWSADSKQLVTACDKAAQIWNVVRREVVSGPMLHDGPVNSVEFSADGNRIVTASDDQTTRVWRVPTGEPITQLRGEHEFTVAKFSPDGTMIITLSFVESGPAGQAAWLRSMNYGGARCELWDTKTGKLSASISKSFVINSVDFSPNSRLLAVASQTGSATVYSLADGKPFVVRLEQEKSIASVRFNPQGTHLLTASFDGFSRIYDVRNGRQCAMTLRGVTSGTFVAGGEEIFVMSGSQPGSAVNSRTGQPLASEIHAEKPIQHAYLSTDEKRVAIVFQESAQVWDRFGLPLTGPLLHRAPVTLAAFSPDNKRLLTVENATPGSVNGKDDKLDYHALHIWTENGTAAIPPIVSESSISDASWAADSKRILSVSGEEVRVSDTETGSPILPPLKHEGDDSEPTVARFDLQGRNIAVGFADYTAQIWDARNGQAVTAPLKHHKYLGDIQFSPDGKKLLTEVHDLGVARIWSSLTGRPLTPDLKAGDVVTSAVSWRPNGKLFATNTAIWDAESGIKLGDVYYEGGDRLDADSLKWNPQGTRILLCREPDSDVVDVSPPAPCPGWLPRLAEAVGGRRLNEEELIELTPLPVEDIKTVEATLNAEDGGNIWVAWGRWLLTNRSTRTISPFSKITVPEYIENRIKENTAGSLDEAEQLAVGNAELLKRIAIARAALPQTAPR